MNWLLLQLSSAIITELCSNFFREKIGNYNVLSLSDYFFRLFYKKQLKRGSDKYEKETSEQEKD